MALLVVAAIVIAGLWLLRSGPDSDDCQRWQTLVRQQAQLLANGRPVSAFYESAANTYAGSRPEGCALPS